MITLFVDPYEREIVLQNVDYAKQQQFIPSNAGVLHLRSLNGLNDLHTAVLAVKHTLLTEPALVAWRARHPQHRLVVLWAHAPHPQEVVRALAHAPNLWLTAVYDDLRRRDFWERMHVQRSARDLVGEFAQQLLLDAEAWHTGARPVLQRIALNLDSANLQRIAAMLYTGADPVHTVRRRLRAHGHAAPKTLLMAAQLAAWRYAVDQGAGTLDAARAVGRDTVESWRRSAREALGPAYTAYIGGAVPPTWYIEQTRALFRAHSGDPLSACELPELFECSVSEPEVRISA